MPRRRRAAPRRKTVRPIPPHGDLDIVRPVPSLSFDPRARRWRRPNGRFAADPKKSATRRTQTDAGNRVFWDPATKHYRDRVTKRFVSPDRKDLVVHRYLHKPKPPKAGTSTQRWKVSFGGGLQYQRRAGKKKAASFIEWDVVGRYDTTDAVLAVLASKSQIFREVLETGAYPQIALVGRERGKPRFTGRRVKLRVKYESHEFESG